MKKEEVEKVHLASINNNNFIFILCGILVLFVCLLISINFLNKPFYVYLDNDEEQDYLGQAIRMHEVSKPADFRHPGLLPKTILYWAVQKDNYTVESVQKAFHIAGTVGFIWLAFCLVSFVFLIKPYIVDVSPAFFLPLIFISPATFYWLLKYGSNFFSIGMYVLLMGILFRGLVLNKNEEFDMHWIAAAAFAFGFGTAIRVTFIPFFFLFFLTIIIFLFLRKDTKFNLKYAGKLDFIPILALITYLPINFLRKVVRLRETGVLLGIIVLFALLIMLIRRNKEKLLVRLLGYMFIYYLLGFTLGMCGFASSMRKPIFSELNLFSLHHYLEGIKVIFNYAPLLIVMLFISIASLSFMIIYCFRHAKNINQRRAAPLILFLGAILTGGTLISISHYSVISSGDIYPGVPLRLVLHVPFFIAGLFTVLIPFLRPRFLRLYPLMLILISVICFTGVIKQYQQIKEGIKKENLSISEINKFFTDKKIIDPVLFIEVVNEAANIHYAMRNWGRNAGLDKFHEHYPNIFEVNPVIRDQQAVEDICTKHNIKYVVTDIKTLNNPEYAAIKRAVESFTKVYKLANGVIILE